MQEIVDEEDEKLQNLKQEWGNDIYMAVITALKELNEYNPSGRYVVAELWNFKEQRGRSFDHSIVPQTQVKNNKQFRSFHSNFRKRI